MRFNEITIENYLFVSGLLFCIGVAGLLLSRKSVINVMMSIELMLLSVNINFVAFSIYLQDIVGQIYIIFVLCIAAAEVSIGLAILVLYFRKTGSVEIEDISKMRG